VSFFRSFPLVCLGASLFASLGSAGVQTPAEPGKKPNVLLVLMDATRADYLSCYGHPRKTTPEIDRIAAEGAVFEDCIAAASWTLPSLASILTGLYPHSHGVSAKNLNLRAEYRTLAEYLGEAGYRTRGFSCNPWVGYFSGLDQGFEKVEDIWRDITADSADAGAALATHAALNWVDSVPDGQPFFAFIHYMEPHFPYRPPPPFDTAFAPAGMGRALLDRVRSWKSPRELGYIVKDPDSLISDQEFRGLRAEYEGEIGYLDGWVGKLVKGLAERGKLDATFLVLLADHGEHLGDHHLLDHKFSVYESLIRVPLIVRYPSTVPPGVRVHDTVQTIDLVPTLARLCGFEALEAEGRELPWNDSPNLPQRIAYSEIARPLLFTDVIEQHFPMADYSPIDRALLAVRSRPYKLIRASDQRHELYDLSTDPGEEKNLFRELPDIAAGLLREAAEFQKLGRSK